MRRAAFAVLLLLTACAHPAPRFADRQILWRDPDDAPIPVPPEHFILGTRRVWPGVNNAVFRPAERVFNVEYGLEAQNVNAVDDVPDSSWYFDPRRDPARPWAPPRALGTDVLTHRIPGEPLPQPPFRITKALEGGSAAGFVAIDALGRKYALKFDPESHPGLVTGADSVATRLVWASGWRAPDDEIVDLRRSDLIVEPGATIPNRWGQLSILDDGELDAILWHTAHDADGVYRVVASRWIDGHVLGPFEWKGRDVHDPNDRTPHEDRRDLRGFGTFAAWIDDVDLLENNTLDSYVGAPGRGHVVHYQLDVGGSFGTFAARPAPYWMGDQSYFQFGHILGSIATLGVFPHRWEDPRWQRRRRAIIEQYPELGGYSAEHFEPRKWRPIVDIPPLVRATARDRYWGAKRVAAFSRTELDAVVAAARYRPATATYLADTLWRRREIVARDAFSETNPLDHFGPVGSQMCFTDLWVRSGLGGDELTVYRAQEDGRDVAVVRGAARDGAVCMTLPAGEGYRVVSFAAQRPGERRFGPAVSVHFVVRGARPRVVGVLR